MTESDAADRRNTDQDLEVAEEFFRSLKEDTLRLQKLSLEELYSVQLGSGNELLSAETFEEMNLKKELLKAVYTMGFEKPSSIQRLAIPHILAGRDVVFQSCSGTGKTIAFTLGLLNKVTQGEGPQAIVITPTRELCNQVAGVIEGLAGAIGLKVCRALSNFVASTVTEEIIVGCPGKILSFLHSKTIEPMNIRMVVLDEADELISYQTFTAQTLKLLKAFSKAQKVLFSATYSEFSQKAARRFVPDCDTFFEKNTAARQIKFYHLDVSSKQKIEALKEMLCYITVAQVIIFCNRRNTVDTVTAAFRNDQYSVSAIHGKMEPSVRDDSFFRFAQAKTKVLVSTDVFSRGMDIPQVNLIINFDLPAVVDSSVETVAHTYIHRVGRSGRFNRPGFVVDVLEGDKSVEEFENIQKEAKITSKKLTLEALKKVFEKNELASVEGL